MAQAHNKATTLHYDVRGPHDAPPVLLIMGLGAQMIAWQDEFCDQLVEHGHRVIRFDNRDAGLSSKTDAPLPTTGDLARLLGPASRRPSVPYTLSDMADDAMAVLDAEGVESAHIVGASLGGMIAQTVAIEHSHRVRSLTSIMSKTGAMFAGLPTPKTLKMLLTERPARPEDAVEADLARYELIAGPLFDRERTLAFVKTAIERSYNPSGAQHQLAAMFASGDRTAKLRNLNVPTLVMHGRRDKLVRLSGGEATASAIPGAELIVYNEMGHDLPRPLWSRMTDSIAGLTRRAEAARTLSDAELLPA